MKRPERFAAATVVFLAAAAVYSNSLSGPFIYDDALYVVQNEQVRDPGIFQVFSSSYPPQLPQLGLYRPVTVLSYALDAAIGGVEPFVFHLSSVALHGAVSVLVLMVLLSLGSGISGATFGALLFAVHPIHTEAVAWIAGRAEVLSGLFCLAAFLLYARHRRSGANVPLVLSAGAYFLAIGSKEIAAPLPAILLVAEALGLFDEETPRRSLGSRTLWVTIVFGVPLLAYVALRVDAIGAFGMPAESTVFATRPAGTRPATVLAAAFEYARLCLLPLGLHVDYGEFFYSLRSPRVLAGVAVVVGMAVFGWKARRRAPRVSLGLAWFAVFLLPVSNILVPIGASLAERFLYLPSVALAILAGEAALLASRRWRPALPLLAGLTLLVGFGIATVQRNRVWGDGERFYRAMLTENSSSEKAYLGLYEQLAARGRLAEAVTFLRAGAALRTLESPTFTDEHVKLLHSLARLELAAERPAAALSVCERLIRVVRLFDHLPNRRTIEADANFLAGKALTELGRPEHARRAFQEAERLLALGDTPTAPRSR